MYRSAKLRGLTLYVCENDQCHHILPAATNDACVIVERVPEFACDHEEADTRMLLHASHATRYNNVLVRSPDTDVFVLLLHFSLTIPAKLYFLTGVKDRTRILDMEYIVQQLGAEKCKALIGFHSFTGCDSTSSFYGYSKVSSWNILLHDPTSVATLTSLGTEFSFDEQFEKKIEATV
ncbi:Hypothetical predicted protein [Paramuricea clavata]|uniref:Uncharacterized protein n=1 Tax=Paramuricea clavata TaxID=317549 RepID=A0A6S7JK26_PARCT|nr:Hypothetical predicted protein [Paramuricea clavata]